MSRSKINNTNSYDRGICQLLAAFIAVFFACVTPAAAHDIPNDIKVTAYLRPMGERLEFLLRVPMEALIEVDFPRRGPGYIDLPRVDEALRGAVKLYITDNITPYENGEPLPTPRLAQVRVSLPSDRSFISY